MNPYMERYRSAVAGASDPVASNVLRSITDIVDHAAHPMSGRELRRRARGGDRQIQAAIHALTEAGQLRASPRTGRGAGTDYTKPSQQTSRHHTQGAQHAPQPQGGHTMPKLQLSQLSVEEIVAQLNTPTAQDLILNGTEAVRTYARDAARLLLAEGHSARDTHEATNRIFRAYEPALEKAGRFRGQSATGADLEDIANSIPTL